MSNQICSSNFNTVKNTILSLIHQCEFIAFDCEFSGLSMREEDEHNIYDSIEDRYQKIKNMCQNGIILTIGLCFYVYNPETDVYVAHPYNFYIFPSTEGQKGYYVPVFAISVTILLGVIIQLPSAA
jgi:poly(A)-specific ribonuclease